ncbi:MAG: lipocalin family protein [Sporocytophaga sp.]|nr:lipocalin family protein [Sporocytophaga sp.]
MKFKLTLLALSGLLVFAGCKKDKDDDATPNNPPQNTNTKELLVGKNWKLTKANTTTDTANILTNPFYSALVGCITDDILTFKDDNTYTLSDGETPCSAAILPESGTWEVSQDQKSLITNKGTDEEKTLTIVEVTASKVRVNTEFEYMGGVIPVEGTFTAQ